MLAVRMARVRMPRFWLCRFQKLRTRSVDAESRIMLTAICVTTMDRLSQACEPEFVERAARAMGRGRWMAARMPKAAPQRQARRAVNPAMRKSSRALSRNGIAAGARQQQSLGHGLANQAATACPECRPHCKLPLARGAASHQEAGYIAAGDK